MNVSVCLAKKPKQTNLFTESREDIKIGMYKNIPIECYAKSMFFCNNMTHFQVVVRVYFLSYILVYVD